MVSDAELDFAGVDEAFRVLRFSANCTQYAPLVKQRAEWVKDEIKYEVAQAERYTGGDVGRAMARQAWGMRSSRPRTTATGVRRWRR